MGMIENFEFFKSTIPDNVKLVAVSKTKPVEDILNLYNLGQKDFGENKAQEILAKQPLLPTDICWHFIGHLQTNKVKSIIPFVSMIHSIDSLKLLIEVNKQAEKHTKIIDCLLQFHIATEETKFGLDSDEASQILNSPEFTLFNNIRICGVMGMATFTENIELVRNEFNKLKTIFNELKQKFFNEKDYFKEISMGMSDDYKIAIEEGSTIVRIGSALFGERNKVAD
jgi:pyridoxal phosphate enzyme (YggS family)